MSFQGSPLFHPPLRRTDGPDDHHTPKHRAQQLGWSPDKKYILFGGAFSNTRKNYALLRDAVAQLGSFSTPSDALLGPFHSTSNPQLGSFSTTPDSLLSPFHSPSDPQLVPQVTNSSSDSLQKEQAKPYFILRFASLNAHHDSGIKGINTEIAQRLVDILKPHGRIYITSERPLEPQFEQYRIKINPLDMHHVMAFASLYIGDSQTMAAEAGVLGTPFVRFNDFVGRIGYLRELEDLYQLGYGIKASSEGSVGALCARVSELVAMNPAERHATFAARRATMLADKIDCAKFLTYFIEEYPKSAEQTRQGRAEFWDRFM